MQDFWEALLQAEMQQLCNSHLILSLIPRPSHPSVCHTASDKRWGEKAWEQNYLILSLYSICSMDEIPPGHSGILQSVDGTDARTHLSEAIGKQSQRSYGYGSRQGHYGQSEQSLYGHGQSAYDRGRQSAYDRGGQGAYDRGGQGAYDHGGQGAYDHGGQGVYEHGGQGAHGQGSHGYSGQQSSYGYTVHLYVRNQDPYSSGGQASGSQTSHSHTGNSPYSGGSTRSASADSATGGRRWKSYYESGGQGGSYGQSASASSGYASGYDGGQDTYSYGGARASAYDPDDEEPVSVHAYVVAHYCHVHIVKLITA